MEKRRNTLDRWQRLGFGRRAASNPPEDKKSTHTDVEVKRSSDKSERLRELTELLKVSRGATNQSDGLGDMKLFSEGATKPPPPPPPPPPVPPPRKPRTSLVSTGSIEKFIDTSASESGSPAMNTKYDHSTYERSPKTTQNLANETQRSNAKQSHVERRDIDKTKLPQPEENTLFKGCENKIRLNSSKKRAAAGEGSNRPESRSVIGAYAQKTIPFRSASFSQVDYTSGKYIRSALGALKASLTKAKSPPPIAENKCDRSSSSSPETPECTNIWIPLKDPCDKRNDLNLDRIDATAMSNIILEEDSETSPIPCHANSTGFMPSEASTSDATNPLLLSVLNVGEMTTDSPPDESLSIQGVENLFQAASNSLRTLPVYERICHQSDNLHLADEWLNACEIDSEKILAELVKASDRSNNNNELPVYSVIHDDDASTAAGRVGKAKIKRNANVMRDQQSPTLDVDELPAIAVTPGSSISGSSFEEADNVPLRTHQQPASEYVVRKRCSAGDKHAENRSSDGTQSTSTSGTNSPKSHHDEKRRIDKSKRRKGVYIQWATLDKHNKELSAVSWAPLDHSHELAEKMLPAIDSNGQPIWAVYHNENIGTNRMNKECHSAPSLEAISAERKCSSEKNPNDTDPCTPESDGGRQQLIWQRRESATNRRQSLTLQSSEEKDESPPTSKPPSKMFVLRSDSCSDNELSDKTPPPRERASQSPAPDQDLKRYSKRPLRGPYGQMLEAEMKKPAKQNYDGLLEELNRSER